MSVCPKSFTLPKRRFSNGANDSCCVCHDVFCTCMCVSNKVKINCTRAFLFPGEGMLLQLISCVFRVHGRPILSTNYAIRTDQFLLRSRGFWTGGVALIPRLFESLSVKWCRLRTRTDVQRCFGHLTELPGHAMNPVRTTEMSKQLSGSSMTSFYVFISSLLFILFDERHLPETQDLILGRNFPLCEGHFCRPRDGVFGQISASMRKNSLFGGPIEIILRTQKDKPEEVPWSHLNCCKGLQEPVSLTWTIDEQQTSNSTKQTVFNGERSQSSSCMREKKNRQQSIRILTAGLTFGPSKTLFNGPPNTESKFFSWTGQISQNTA